PQEDNVILVAMENNIHPVDTIVALALYVAPALIMVGVAVAVAVVAVVAVLVQQSRNIIIQPDIEFITTTNIHVKINV
ncbi:MAG: hypothetical protein OEY66_04935, partial [Gammaproteobacteria bacterium]|nr:hypothetical protein [Gammaproteobacteria bacterium]